MNPLFQASLSRSFAHSVSVFGAEVLLNGETVQAIVSEPEFSSMPEEGGTNIGGDLTIRISRTTFDEFGKAGDPRKNLFTVNGQKYRPTMLRDTPESPILIFETRQDQ
jgi:hypothetical protein